MAAARLRSELRDIMAIFPEIIPQFDGADGAFLGDEALMQEITARRQLETLPPVQREAVELAYFRGMSQREIAATTNTPLGTVKTRLQLGLRKLTQCVRPMRSKI